MTRFKKYWNLYFLLFAPFLVHSQDNAKTTDQIVINGAVKNTFSFSLKNAKAFNQYSIDSVVIYNHLLERKRTIHNIKGVLLKDVLEKAELNGNNPKLLSEYYFTCIASDGYKVVFSWNELFNTDIGNKVMIITGAGNKNAEELNDHIAIISPLDKATGRRYVKNLQEIKVERVR